MSRRSLQRMREILDEATTRLEKRIKDGDSKVLIEADKGIIADCQRLISTGEPSFTHNLPKGWVIAMIGREGEKRLKIPTWENPMAEEYEDEEETPTDQKVCTCGAKYTSNPNYHMPNVCDLA